MNELEPLGTGCPECWDYTRDTYARLRGNAWPQEFQDSVAQSMILGFTRGHHG